MAPKKRSEYQNKKASTIKNILGVKTTDKLKEKYRKKPNAANKFSTSPKQRKPQKYPFSKNRAPPIELTIKFPGGGVLNCKPVLEEILKSSRSASRPKKLRVMFPMSEVAKKLSLLNNISVNGKKLLIREISSLRERDPLRRLVSIQNKKLNAETVRKAFNAESIEKVVTRKPSLLHILKFESEEIANEADTKNVVLKFSSLKVEDYFVVRSQ